MTGIYELTNEIKAIESEEDLDRDTIIDTISSLDIESALDGAQRWRKNIAGDIAAIDEEVNRLNGRKSALKNKDQNIKEAMMLVMKKSNKNSLKTPLFSFSVRKGSESVVVNDAYAASLESKGLAQTETIYKYDKKAIKEWLKSGKALDGAIIETGSETLAVR